MRDRYLAQNPQAAWRVYDGEAVIISPEDSRLHTLNAVGTLIWQAADGKTAVSGSLARICEEFEIEPERAERDLYAFIEHLCERGLLEVSESPQEGPEWKMAMDKGDDTILQRRGDQTVRRLYEPPMILSEEIFETTALACGKIAGQSGRCNARPRAS